MSESERYDAFVNGLKSKYPEMYSDVYCGIFIGEGWYKIIEDLSHVIYSNISWIKNTRERLLVNNPYNHKIPDEVEFPQVTQIKEKFGGLRFYYDGGNDFVDGAVAMAEACASHTCEKCGKPGSRRSGGWLRTLCDQHEEEYQLVKLGNQNESRN